MEGKREVSKIFSTKMLEVIIIPRKDLPICTQPSLGRRAHLRAHAGTESPAGGPDEPLGALEQLANCSLQAKIWWPLTFLNKVLPKRNHVP